MEEMFTYWGMEIVLAYIWFNLNFKDNKDSLFGALKQTLYASLAVMGGGEHIQRIAQGHILIMILTAVCLLVFKYVFKSSMTE